eukprot:jgi/Mesen1/3879/ME000208S02886
MWGGGSASGRESDVSHVILTGPTSSSLEGSSAPRVKQRRRPALDWASIIFVYAVLYVFFGFIFWALLELAEYVRGEDYRVLPPKYYGPFKYGSSPPIPNNYTAYPPGFGVPWDDTLFPSNA